jgi:hypothetical protein
MPSEVVCRDGAISWSTSRSTARGIGPYASSGYKPKRNSFDIFKKLGESFKRVEFDISELILSIEPEKIDLTEPLVFKVLYAHDDDGLEFEIEVEWSLKKNSRINDTG